MTELAFDAFELHADQSLRPASHLWSGSPEHGWTLLREGREHLRLPDGYRPLRVTACGVCSTDLARHHLPFPLPQVIGHEVLVRDEHGRRHVVEINASHRARGSSERCAFCDEGRDHHCPERLVLGIDRLPGGFGPWILAPRENVLPVPDCLTDETAVLVEPFAAALHGAESLHLEDGDRVAVLGPRRLGLLVVAALAALRAERGAAFRILGIARRKELASRAVELGADEGWTVEQLGREPVADVVVDTTGAPEGLERALELAAREVHLKSTHGRPACGLAQLTALVVDELSIARASASGTSVTQARDARAGSDAAPRHARLLAERASDVDLAIRPLQNEETSLLLPGGTIELSPQLDPEGSSLLAAVVDRDLRLSSSRCGDFARALQVLEQHPNLHDLGTRFVTHRFTAEDLGSAFRIARGRDCIKAIVEHPVGPSSS